MLVVCFRAAVCDVILAEDFLNSFRNLGLCIVRYQTTHSAKESDKVHQTSSEFSISSHSIDLGKMGGQSDIELSTGRSIMGGGIGKESIGCHFFVQLLNMQSRKVAFKMAS